MLKSLPNRAAPYRPTPFLTPARHRHSDTIGPAFSIWHLFHGLLPRTLRVTCKLPPPTFQHLPSPTGVHWAQTLRLGAGVASVSKKDRLTAPTPTPGHSGSSPQSTWCAVGTAHILPAPGPSPLWNLFQFPLTNYPISLFPTALVGCFI